MKDLLDQPFARAVSLQRETVSDYRHYPFSIPAVRKLETLAFHPKVTFFVGDNGSGKSTVLEAVALAAGFNPEGGSRNFNFETRASHSTLHEHLRLVKGPVRFRDGFFLRAESYFNLASEIEELDREPAPGPPIIDGFGGVPLHEMSHGESFLALLENRLRGHGLYIFDEPEAALSPSKQLRMLAIMHRLIRSRSQFIIATHSPILMAYPEAILYSFGPDGIHQVEYEDTEHYQVTRRIIEDRDRYLRLILQDDGE